jgi:hypothetical protein
LNLPGGHDTARQVATFHGGKLGGINFMTGAQGGIDAVTSADNDESRDGDKDDTAAALLGCFSIPYSIAITGHNRPLG